MILLRFSFLVMLLSISIIREPTLGADHNDDRIGTILSYMVQMRDDMKLLNQKVDGVQTEVKDVARIEELTSDHLLKLEEKVADVIEKQGKMEKQILEGDRNIENQVKTVDKKIERIDKDTWIGSFGWTFIGNGVQGAYDDQVTTRGLTLGQCIEHCQQHRMDAGIVWNGLVYRASDGWCGCDKNSRGIRTAGWDGWVLYRVQ